LFAASSARLFATVKCFKSIVFHYRHYLFLIPKNQTIMLLAIMRKAAMLMLAVIGFTAFAKAQTVTGTVTDTKGDPISGISVTVKGGSKGTSTNA
jgi:hypothetical protein